MSKTGKCSFCRENATVPNSECLFSCQYCSSKSLFLCHVIPLPKDPMHIRCKECKNQYSMYNCPQCQAFAVIKDFKSGKMYNCLCGFQATMVECNLCTALLCLPTRKNYELTAVRCKKCDNNFKYRLCSACGECSYLKSTQNSADVPCCFNEECPLSQKERVKVEMPNVRVNRQPEVQMLVEGNPYEAVLGNPKKDNQMCNICLNKEKCMINTSCYHLSVCEACSVSLNRQCPICRAVGDYKKVFRS